MLKNVDNFPRFPGLILEKVTQMTIMHFSLLRHLLLLFVLLLAVLCRSSALSESHISQSSPLSAHAELKTRGFPAGLLPAPVLSYSLNRTSGDFAVNFGDSCRITLQPDNYLVSYSRRVTGRLVASRISELDGIRVRAFFNWWSITGIQARGENLVFEVGGITAKYPAKNFDESPACEGRKSDS